MSGPGALNFATSQPNMVVTTCIYYLVEYSSLQAHSWTRLVLPVTIYRPGAPIFMTFRPNMVVATHIYVVPMNFTPSGSLLDEARVPNGHSWALGTYFHISFVSFYIYIVAISDNYCLYEYNTHSWARLALPIAISGLWGLIFMIFRPNMTVVTWLYYLCAYKHCQDHPWMMLIAAMAISGTWASVYLLLSHPFYLYTLMVTNLHCLWEYNFHQDLPWMMLALLMALAGYRAPYFTLSRRHGVTSTCIYQYMKI